MSKANLLALPRSGININLTKRQARKVMKALGNASVTDPEVAAVYDLLKSMLEDK